MVRKLVQGLTRMPVLVAALCVAALLATALLLWPERSAAAATYSTPWWTVTASVQEKECQTCSCEAPGEIVEPGVSVLTGELILDLPIASSPTMHGSMGLSLRYRSMISGRTEFGNRMIPSWMATVQETIHDAGSPLSNGGTSALVRLPSGVVVNFVWNGSAFATTDCCFHETLSKNGSGRYVLTALDGSTRLFNADGMPHVYTDRHGNDTVFTYNGSLQCTGWTNDRGVQTTLSHDGDGFVEELEVDGLFTYTFAYDGDGNLIEIGRPATPDQTGGTTITPRYDVDGRLVAVENARGIEPFVYTYVSTSAQIAYATGSTISFAYTTGQTDVTDRNGVVTRYEHSGRNVTKVEQRIGGSPAFTTTYTYSGGDLIKVVRPRGNRVDYTVNGVGLVTARRQKTTDTDSTSGSDIVETWAYTNNFVTSYTSPRGHTTVYSRDGAGRVTAITFPTVTSPSTQSGVTKTYSYNGQGQRTQAVDEEGQTTEYEYYASGDNKYGLLKKVKVDPSGLNLVTEYLYNGSQQLASVTDPEGHTTAYVFDALGRKVKVTTPTGIETEWHYDGSGNVTSVDVENLDQAGARVSGNEWLTTSYTYGSHDQRLTVVEELDAVTTRTTTCAAPC